VLLVFQKAADGAGTVVGQRTASVVQNATSGAPESLGGAFRSMAIVSFLWSAFA
jgi:hypothetical protein